MSTDSSSPTPERRFEIDYQEFAGSRFNPDFRGSGTLTVRANGSALVFSGKKRRSILAGEAIEQVFAPNQIWNVRVDGRCVQFTTALGRAGEKQQPFVFVARSEAEAREAAALLPERKDAEYFAGAEFASRLQQLDRPTRAWESPTNLIIAANVFVFILMGVAGAGWFEVADMMPYIRFGANRADLTTDGEWWRLVSCMFIHFGLLHLLLNMWALLQVGHLTEKLFGRGLYALAYFGSGITGSLATLLWHREKLVLSAGASGAVFGVYGALLGYMLREKHGLPKVVVQPLMKSTLVFAGYNLFYGAVHPNIDNAAHIGGLVGGLLLGWVMALPIDREIRVRLRTRRAGMAVVIVALLVAGGAMLAPRFDYRLVDELAWTDVLKPAAEKEQEILHHREAVMKNLIATNDRAAAIRWLKDEPIPFYRKWNADLNALNLAPGRATERRRAALTKVLQKIADSYEHLATGLENNEANALNNFAQEQQAISVEIKELSPEKK